MTEVDTDCVECDLHYRAPITAEHRVFCGDSTSGPDVAFLLNGTVTFVLADPPYNVGKDYGAETDDEQEFGRYLAWNRLWYALAKAATESCVVMTVGITNLPMWVADIERTHRIIAWVKENQNSRNYIGTTSGFNVWEPVLVYGKAKKCVPRDAFSIPIAHQSEAEGHPVPKSLDAWKWLVENFSESGDSVYDPFSGSGTTVIACEQMERLARAMEIEPAYCDLAVRRWERVSARTAVLVRDGVVVADRPEIAR